MYFPLYVTLGPKLTHTGIFYFSQSQTDQIYILDIFAIFDIDQISSDVE